MTVWLALVIPAAMLVALLVDRALGEPPPRWHPVVAIGRYLERSGRGLPQRSPRAAFCGGVLAWCLGAALVTALAAVVQAVLWRWLSGSVAGAALLALLLGLLLKPLLAWRLLREEVAAVEIGLGQSLAAGRARIARISSRDSSRHGASAVRETAIETLAENLNDSVVAPLFWFAIAGLPGAALYRFANTADAMWGYRGEWEWAGKWAAHADDVLSWLPARITAVALLPQPARWRQLARAARVTPSPNGGWPMGAMAIALGARLTKPGVYVLNPGGRAVEAGDISAAMTRAARALILGVAVLALLALVVNLNEPF
ncbi:MAG: adenosylcobinamide-phosphate synthase CbiB [Burkholderiaceae bacterium]